MTHVKRDNIFISYSHKDSEWLEKLQTFLKPLFRGKEEERISALGDLQPVSGEDVQLGVWDDSKIKPGDNWYTNIEQAIEQACVAVLLITPEFLASDFIMKHEVPMLIKARDESGLKILWIAISATVFDETALGEIQGLNNPSKPLDSLETAKQNSEMVKISKRIKELAAPISFELPPDQSHQSFDLHMDNIVLCVTDQQSRLWISDGQSVRIYPAETGRSPQRLILPEKHWKHHLKEIWQDRLVISDWDGSLYQCPSQSDPNSEVLYKAKHDDLPIHRLAVGPEGQLVAATWNGLIRTWAASGRIISPQGSQIKVPELPLHLIPLADFNLGIVDQANVLRMFDPNGQELWRWQAEGEIQSAWAYESRKPLVFVLQIGPDRLVKCAEGRQEKSIKKFDAPIVSLSHRRGGDDNEWTVIASQGGQIDWFSGTQCTVVKSCSVSVEFEIQNIIAVRDDHQPDRLLALGTTAEGVLFTLNEHEVSLCATQDPVQRAVLDSSERFLFLLGNNRLSIIKNPALASTD